MSDLNVNLKNQKAGMSLAGEDILPVRYEERSVTPKKLVAIWIAMAIELTLFFSVIDLYQSMPIWEIMLACLFGHCLLFVVMWVTQDIGIKYGLSFGVSLRPAFGYAGALFASYFRAVPAVFWFGFQTWVAADAVNQICNVLFGYENLVIWIIIIGAVQILHTTLGIKAVSRLSVFAMPMLIIVGIYITVIAISDYNLSMTAIWTMGGTSHDVSFMYAAVSFMGGWATMCISIMDITKDCVTNEEECSSFKKITKKYLPAQFLGIVPAVCLYTFVGAIGVVTTGKASPAEILVAMSVGKSQVLLVIVLIFVVVATWCTNDTANLFPAGFALANTFPKHLNFAKSIIIAGVVGIVIQPWNAADSITNVMTIIGNLLAPVSGILISDYFFLRKRELNLDALYDNEGQYKYFHNFNPAAIISLVVGYFGSMPFGDYTFFFALGISGVLYYVLMKTWIIKKYPQSEIK